jgi:apolipoprotein N-acyltransferase
VILLLFLLAFFLLTPSNINSNWKYFIFAIIWIVYEILLIEWEIRYPMLSVGVILGNFPAIIQWYSLTGIIGGSLWILLINLFVLKLIKKEHVSLLYLLIFFPVIISLVIFSRKKSTYNKTNIVSVNLKDENFEESINIIEKVIDSTTNLILCPEGLLYLPSTSFPVNKYFSRIKRLLKSKSPNASLIFGCKSNTIGKFKINDDSIYNLVIQCDTSGFVNFRNKCCLVPFGEFIPYEKYLGQISLIKKIVSSPVSTDSVFDNTFDHNNIEILPLICYELYFSNKIRKYFINNSIGTICCIGDEYSVPNKTYYTQFTRMARIQAITFKTPIIKSTINGYSSLIDDKGKIISTDYNTNEAIKGDIKINPQKTFYSKYNYLAICLFFIITVIILTINSYENKNTTYNY